MIAFFSLLAAFNEPIFADLESYGVYACASLRAHKMGKNYALSSAIDNTVLLLDGDGRLIAKYDKKGQGPGELNAPFIMGVWDKEIFVASKNRRLMVFDDRLNLLERDLPPLPQMITGGTALGAKRFLVGTHLHFGHWFTELILTDVGWESGKTYFPVEYDASNSTFFSYFKMQNGTVIAHPGLIREDHYQVQVFPSGSDQPALGFGAPTEEWKGPNISVWTNQALRSGSLFIVNLGVYNDQTKMVEAQYVDTFDKDGRFLKREKPQEELWFVTVTDSSEVWVVNCERMQILRVLDGSESAEDVSFGL